MLPKLLSLVSVLRNALSCVPLKFHEENGRSREHLICPDYLKKFFKSEFYPD